MVGIVPSATVLQYALVLRGHSAKLLRAMTKSDTKRKLTEPWVNYRSCLSNLTYAKVTLDHFQTLKSCQVREQTWDLTGFRFSLSKAVP